MNQELERLRQCPTREDSLINATMQSYTTDDTTAYTDSMALYNIFQTATSDLFTNFLSTSATDSPIMNAIPTCHRILVNCTKSTTVAPAILSTLFLLNFTTTVFPEIMQQTKMADVFSSTMSSSTIDFDPMANTTEWYESNFTTPYEVTNFNDTMGNATDFELRLTTPAADDYYEYDDTSGDGQQQNRQRRDVNDENYSFYEYADDPVASTKPPEYVDATDFDSTNFETTNFDTTDFDGNFTEMLSSTVSTFLDNVTLTSMLDLTNETMVSEAWTEYLTTTYSDSSFSTTESPMELTTQPDDEPENDLAYEVDEDGNCYVVVCVQETVATETPEMIETTEMTYKEEEMTEPETEMFTVASSLAPSIVEYFNTSATNVSAAQMCVPFRRNNADNITGIPPEYVGRELRRTINKMNVHDQLELRDLCWETLFGQELVKLTVLDLIFTIITTLFMDFFRALFVRFMNKFWCWDLEKKWPKVIAIF